MNSHVIRALYEELDIVSKIIHIGRRNHVIFQSSQQLLQLGLMELVELEFLSDVLIIAFVELTLTAVSLCRELLDALVHPFSGFLLFNFIRVFLFRVIQRCLGILFALHVSLPYFVFLHRTLYVIKHSPLKCASVPLLTLFSYP